MGQARRRKYHELVDTPHIVYRFKAEDGRLLYVGVTRTFGSRFEQHVLTKPWWPEVATIDLTHYRNGVDAHIAEAAAIEIETPEYNVSAPNVKALFDNARPIRPQRPAGQATTCPKCGAPKQRPKAPYCNGCQRQYQRERRAILTQQ
jgi:hypothetical protein